ncbi:unnamed protein product, partial [Rotaria sp. Silwood2]
EKNNDICILPADNAQQRSNDPNIKSNLAANDLESYLVEDDNERHSLTNDNIELDVFRNDQEATIGQRITSSRMSWDQEKDIVNISIIQKSYASFMLQLREELFLPKSITNSISSYIGTLLNYVESLLEQNVVTYDSSIGSILSSSQTMHNSPKKTIEIEMLNSTMNQVRDAVESIIRNEYQFLNYCKNYFDYNPTEQIIVSAPGEKLDYAYYISMDKTLFSIFNNQHILIEILDNIKRQQKITTNNEDFMFSFRNANYGTRIDDDNLLIQLYADEIGLTNPIGVKKDQHKMFMIYFSLEDIPDQRRSVILHKFSCTL